MTDEQRAFRAVVRAAVKRFGWWAVLFHATEVLRDEWEEGK